MKRPNGLWRDIPTNVNRLREMGQEDIRSYLSQLSAKELEELTYMWEFWARPEQLEPEGNWKVWIPLAGGVGEKLGVVQSG